MPTADTSQNVLVFDISRHAGNSGNSGIQRATTEVPA